MDMATVAIQGEEGSYYSIAARQYFGSDITLLHCTTFKDVFSALQSGAADYALQAIENSLIGSIHPAYDLLEHYHFWVSGEVYLHVRHCLIGFPGTKTSDITEVHSQSVALDQCDNWFNTYLPKARRVEEHDTAASVRLIKEWGKHNKAAVASKAAAAFYGMSILAEDIEDFMDNYTRFLILQSSQPEDVKKRASLNKTSIVITTSHKPGALHKALGAFAGKEVNLSKLESRPIPGTAMQYKFYLDFESGLYSSKTQQALKELERQKCHVRILGTYKKGPLPKVITT